mmetsp:Transcript_14649/g.25564  ORF Transcript_14649/g.25564 Transcript_14649/m.25564 type:complete len:290 (+) Transcript_14649:4813-5682(+)
MMWFFNVRRMQLCPWDSQLRPRLQHQRLHAQRAMEQVKVCLLRVPRIRHQSVSAPRAQLQARQPRAKKTSGARATMMEESRKAEKSMLEAMAAQSNRKILAKRQSLPGPSGTAIPTSSSMSSSIPSPAPPSGLLPERGDTYETPRKPPGPQKPPQDIFKAPPPPIIPPNATPGEALAAYVAHERSLAGERVRNSAVPPSLFPRELLAESAWETRHFAEATVSNLEASNHGLAEALSLVIAQRDALLDLLAPKNCSEVDPVASTSSSSSSQEEKNMEVDDSTTIEQNPVQ